MLSGAAHLRLFHPIFDFYEGVKLESRQTWGEELSLSTTLSLECRCCILRTVPLITPHSDADVSSASPGCYSER